MISLFAVSAINCHELQSGQ